MGGRPDVGLQGQIMSEVGSVGMRGGIGAGGVNHVAHLGGALAGVMLIMALSRMFPQGGDDEQSGGRGGRGDSDLAKTL